MLNKLRDECYEISKDHGFHDKPKSVGEDIALIHSELSEALEDHRAGYGANEYWYIKDCIKYDEFQEGRKPCGIPSEMADVIIRVLDFCGNHGIDIEKAVIEKTKYNKLRPYKHGKIL